MFFALQWIGLGDNLKLVSIARGSIYLKEIFSVLRKKVTGGAAIAVLTAISAPSFLLL